MPLMLAKLKRAGIALLIVICIIAAVVMMYFIGWIIAGAIVAALFYLVYKIYGWVRDYDPEEIDRQAQDFVKQHVKK